MIEPSALAGAPLGMASEYLDTYSPSVLFPVARAENRRALGIEGLLPFRGVDLWTAYELSWLDRRGKPMVAAARFTVPAESPAIVESKSLKLYLGSFAQTVFDGPDAVRTTIAADLTRAAGAPVDVEIVSASRFDRLALRQWSGESIDGLEVAIDAYQPDAELLALAPGQERVEETLISDLLKSNCPITGQPDWGSLQVRYRGPRIDRVALLRYVVSYRRHRGFHEHCVEQIWCDLRRMCCTETLAVHARYLRRGGLEINPFRGDAEGRPAQAFRLPRQ